MKKNQIFSGTLVCNSVSGAGKQLKLRARIYRCIAKTVGII